MRGEASGQPKARPSPVRAGEPAEGLGARALRGLAWKGASQLLLQLSRLLTLVVLARLVTPREYGLAGMALIVSSALLLFSDLALGEALVQRRAITERDRSTVFWAGVAAGIVLTGAGVVAAGTIASLYGERAVQPLIAVVSCACAITALGSTHAALLTREMDFRSLELRTIGATIVSAAAGITAAVEGYGAWAIVVQQLGFALASTLLLWVLASWRPTFTFSLRSLRDLGGFGGNLFGARAFFFLNRNTDNALVGRFLGAEALGVYALAYNAMLTPLSRLVLPIQDVLFPAFSQLQDDRSRIRDVWLRTTRLIGAVLVPAMLGLAVVADEFVQVVFGERWLPAASVLQILAWVGLLQALSAPNSKILAACDRTGILLRFAAFSFAVYLIAFVIGLRWGIVGVAASYAVAATLVVQPLFLWLTARELEASIGAFLRAISGVAQAALAMLVALISLKLLLVETSLSPGARLGTLVAVGTVTFVLACAWREPQLVVELTRLRPRLRGVRPVLANGSRP